MAKLFLILALLSLGAVDARGENRPDTPKERRSPEEYQVAPGQPVSFAEALTAADQRNLSLAAARQEVARAEARLQFARAALLPVAEGDLQLQHNDHKDSFSFDMGPPGSGGGGTEIVVQKQDVLTGRLSANLPVFNVEKWTGTSLARQGLLVAELTVANFQQQLLLITAQAYFSALVAGSLVEVNRAQVTSAEHQLRVAKAHFDSGTGLRIDVLRAEADLALADQTLLRSILAYDNSRDSLGVLMGLEGLPTPTEDTSLIPPKGNEGELVESALKNREDVQLQRAQSVLADKELNAVWARFWPSVDLGWQLRYQFTEPMDLGSNDRSRWVALLTLTVPIYDQFRYADLDDRRAALKQAAFNEENKELETGKDVRVARRDYLTSLASVEAAERQATFAREALVLAEAAYNAGSGSSLEVTDARRTAISADINHLSQRLRSQIALLSLLRQIGENMLDLTK